MRALGALVALICLCNTVVFAEPAGSYDVVGQGPGGTPRYSGTVVVEPTGDTYRVTWIIANQSYVGTGIGTAEFLAVSYRSGDVIGLAMYSADGDGWKGVWTYDQGTRIGVEHWRRR